MKLEMEFLIHVLIKKGMRLDLKKVQTTKKWQSLVTEKGINSFLELVNFYRKFITFFFHIGQATHGPLKKELSFEWANEQQKMFKKLKEKLSMTLMLKFLDFSKFFETHINANGCTIGGVLMEDRHPLTVESKN